MAEPDEVIPDFALPSLSEFGIKEMQALSDSKRKQEIICR